tara:strand:+ start:1380 stop:2696 length:1317 start_codon:yes stop_codon:yes gene_type:complete
MGRLSAKIILGTSWRRSKKGYNVKIRISKNRKYKYLAQPYFSEKEEWDFISNLPNRNHSDYRFLLRVLSERGERLIKEVAHCNENNLSLEDSFLIIKDGLKSESSKLVRIAQLEAELKELKSQQFVGLLEFYDKVIENKAIEGYSVDAYIAMKRYLTEFIGGGDVSLHHIDYDWVKRFKTFKIKGGCGNGGVAAYLTNLRTVYREAQNIPSIGLDKTQDPIIGNFPKNRSSKAKEIPEDYLDAEDFKKISNYNCENSRNEKIRAIAVRKRDLFLLQIFIGGHDFIDVSRLKWENVKNGRVRFQRYKNRHEKNGGPVVNNILVPEAMKIIEQYGNMENERIFSFIKSPDQFPEQYKWELSNYYRFLQSMKKELKIAKAIRTKSPRFAFRTIAGKLKVSDLYLETIQGHANSSISRNYQGGLELSELDAVLKIIISKIIQ